MKNLWKNRMGKGPLSEKYLLSAVYLLFLVIYVCAQMMILGKVTDILFLVLLSFATLFVNYRQYQLYHSLATSPEGRSFFQKIYPDRTSDAQLEEMFHHPLADLLAVIYAALFGLVMWQFHSWEEYPLIKVLFCVFLAVTNISTGLAIQRLLKYFFYNIKWIDRIQFTIGTNKNSDVRYIKSIRSQVLVTATIYCTASLSSILFTSIELNVIVALYTLFAAGLVIFVLLITDIHIANNCRKKELLFLDRVNEQIGGLLEQAVNATDITAVSKEQIEDLFQIKEYVNRQKNAPMDLSKFLSSLGILFITIIPIILQWLLDYFTS